MLQTVFCRQALGAALLLAVVLTAASAGHAAVEVISLRYRNAAEVLPGSGDRARAAYAGMRVRRGADVGAKDRRRSVTAADVEMLTDMA